MERDDVRSNVVICRAIIKANVKLGQAILKGFFQSYTGIGNRIIGFMLDCYKEQTRRYIKPL